MSQEGTQKVERRKDIDKLIELVEPIVGKRCWRARPSYGEALHVYLGKKITHTGRPPTGEWLLGTSGTQFVIRLDDIDVFVSDRDWEYSTSKVALLEEKLVTMVKIDFPSLRLRVDFGTQVSLFVQPSEQDDTLDLPYWELLVPGGMIIEVGPNREWSHLPVDQSRF